MHAYGARARARERARERRRRACTYHTRAPDGKRSQYTNLRRSLLSREARARARECKSAAPSRLSKPHGQARGYLGRAFSSLLLHFALLVHLAIFARFARERNLGAQAVSCVSQRRVDEYFCWLSRALLVYFAPLTNGILEKFSRD